MTPQELRALCLSFNAAVEDFPFSPGVSVFKVLGKMFALCWLDNRPLTVNLKCDPQDAIRLRADHPGLIIPGYHMNKRHWNTVTVDGELPGQLVRELVEDSYDLVVAGLPRAERLRLDRP
ncbi:MmcQ/YjbR family DNA-binding protein [Streptomyces sp. WI04-05B]|uniref:MmcQ/YjbR family DNA-binding protein n=1 Tax=Streptomyces TaxID=1883 RepID=UPI0029A8480A|nr:MULTISPECIES: MmcQ/YjbR family DNA-binding protein [unclassified Streptomyces]MDX2540267.1 MmcQ/YjbR family DNA-binding protein [Streptomyces sp. WI04-05B]MDX2585300.1 MmcQ/YjbR family DNA-binding protein [Streptomyces sp. WI04-05A]MDX3753374.1 MmcQ/YjbR family DNA-binding protein [Streptomyces sp. AK08-02]